MPRLNKIYVVIFIFIFVISGCATNIGSSQTQDFGKYLSIKEGVSLKTDIFDQFGQPADVTYFKNSESSWVYYSTKMTTSGATFIPIVGMFAGGSNVDTQISRFFFNSESTLIKVQTESKAKYVNMYVGMATAFSSNDYMQRIEDEMAKYELPFDQRAAMQIKGLAEMAD